MSKRDLDMSDVLADAARMRAQQDEHELSTLIADVQHAISQHDLVERMTVAECADLARHIAASLHGGREL